MSKIIKLENIVKVDGSNFDRQTGKPITEKVTEEYVCEGCRHLVGATDKFCWQCGEPLEESSKVEHYHKGEKLSGTKFKERKALL